VDFGAVLVLFYMFAIALVMDMTLMLSISMDGFDYCSICFDSFRHFLKMRAQMLSMLWGVHFSSVYDSGYEEAAPRDSGYEEAAPQDSGYEEAAPRFFSD
jgi:hypothetical protein